MARYQPKDIQYPLIKTEYHIVTPAGVTSCIFDDLKLASARLKKCPATWQIIKVQSIAQPIAPARIPRHDPILKLVEERGIPVIDIPLSIAS